MIRIRTPVKQYAHTGSSEIRTPMKRNLQKDYSLMQNCTTILEIIDMRQRGITFLK